MSSAVYEPEATGERLPVTVRSTGIGLRSGRQVHPDAYRRALSDPGVALDHRSRVAKAFRIGHDTVRIGLRSNWIGIAVSVGLMSLAAFGVVAPSRDWPSADAARTSVSPLW